MSMTASFRADRVVEVYLGLRAVGVEVWLDGGWGLDALLHAQTREHADLDIIVEERHLPATRMYLETLGFRDHQRDDTRAWNFVLANEAGEEIDVHVVNIAGNGDGVYGPATNGQAYPASALAGKGEVLGVAVRCLTPEYQMTSHTGYQLREKDHHDIRALSLRFGLRHSHRMDI